MEEQKLRKPAAQKRPWWRRDLPLLIKYILLLLLVLLVAAEFGTGEFGQFREMGWLAWVVLVIKLILIILLIVLILVQRDLKCELTAPTDCTEEEPDPVEGKLFVRVEGTAAGAAFGSYTLAIRKDGDPPIPGIITYPGGGASGATPVIAGELGQVNTTSLMDGAYEITLTVYPAGAGTPKTCSTSFNLLKVMVYISRVARVSAISMAPIVGNPNPLDPAAELRLDTAPYTPKAVGGWMTMEGSAYIYDCAARKIKRYGIRYAHVAAPGGEPPQPNKDDPIPPAFASLVPPLPLEYLGPDYYQPWTRLGPDPTNLINSWKTMTIGASTFYKLSAGSWDSRGAGSGRHSLLLTAEDTAGHLRHDIQHIWLDNKLIYDTVRIVKFQRKVRGIWEDIPVCVDLLLSFGQIRILGLAWDPVIDDAWPLTPPNDNFGYYDLVYWKQFGPAHVLLANTPTRVPALPGAPPIPTPTDADAGELGQWDLTTLDAGTKPPVYVPPADPKIYRGESCEYAVQLFATDTTVLDEYTTHYRYHVVPVKIVNDL